MTVLAVVITLVVFGLLGASIWYVAYRLRILLGIDKRWLLRTGIAVAVVGAGGCMLGTAKSADAAIGLLNVLGGYAFIFYVFLFLTLLCFHVIQRKWSIPPVWSFAAVLVPALALTGAGAWWANVLTVKETEIRLPQLEREVPVMQISDVHLGHHRGRAFLARIVEETNRRKPDLVLITGDLIDSRAALAPGVLDPLAGLAAPAYFVGGNHEKYVNEQQAFELIARQGVRVLQNEVVETHGIQLVGLDYMNADEDTFDMHPSDNKRTIKSVLAGVSLKSDMPSALIHHSPMGTRYVAARGVDLMITGHTHAGQVFPATLFAGLLFPFNRGLYREGATAVFVSQGAGTFITRVRLGTSNEINLLRLKPGK